MRGARPRGFTLVELVTVLLLVAVLGTVATLRALPAATFQLQASRDTVVMAFFSAQQKAMAQRNAVRLITQSNRIDIRVDANRDGVFSPAESVNVGGVQYPLSLISGQTLSTGQFDFDRLGRTSAARLILLQGAASVAINVSANGALD